MVTLMTQEHEQSTPEYREMTMAQAYALASKGGFYKAQIFGLDGMRYIVVQYVTERPEAAKHVGRFVVVFIGTNCIDMVHYGFNVMA